MARPVRVVVLGSGSWGTTVAGLAARNTPTLLWARNPDTAAEINDTHRNSRYLATGNCRRICVRHRISSRRPTRPT